MTGMVARRRSMALVFQQECGVDRDVLLPSVPQNEAINDGLEKEPHAEAPRPLRDLACGRSSAQGEASKDGRHERLSLHPPCVDGSYYTGTTRGSLETRLAEHE